MCQLQLERMVGSGTHVRGSGHVLMGRWAPVGDGMGRQHAWKVAHREWGGVVVVVGEGGHVTGVTL